MAAFELNGLTTDSKGVATDAKCPVQRWCKVASACAAVRDPPDPIARSGDNPAVFTALHRVVMSLFMAHANVLARWEISLA
jgi:hypothetical protein